MAATSATPKTILVLGATGGVALAALRLSIAAGHTCVALVRTPAKLRTLLGDSTAAAPNLRIETGNAHDAAAISRCLVTGSGALVDVVVFAIGGAFDWKHLTIDDTNVCERGMAALQEALATSRCGHSAGADRPRVVAVSTTGITELGRDVPLLMVPLYHVLLAVPHRDKRAMEAALVRSDEAFTLVRASLLVDGGSPGVVRVGMEDSVAGTVESTAVGYTVSREDVGRWIFENVIQEGADATWVRKTATLSY